MTIAAAYLCSDGIVIASDTQWSGPNKRYAAKIQWFQAGEATVALAMAGDGIPIKRFAHDLAERLQGEPASPDQRRILAIADEILYPLWIKTIKDDNDASAEFLLAIRTSAGMALFENQNRNTFAPAIRPCQCIGCGIPLGQYLSDWLFDANLPIIKGRIVAAHMLRQVKDYDSECGGDSHILMFPSDLSVQPTLLDQETIDKLEGQLDYVKYAAKRLIAGGPGIVGVDMNEETKERRDAAVEKVVSVMGAHYTDVGAGSIIPTGRLILAKIEGGQLRDKDDESDKS